MPISALTARLLMTVMVTLSSICDEFRDAPANIRAMLEYLDAMDRPPMGGTL